MWSRIEECGVDWSKGEEEKREGERGSMSRLECDSCSQQSIHDIK